ncbi:MAG: hypothetical protein AB1Z57_00070 [Acidimicrobiia bacterium]
MTVVLAHQESWGVTVLLVLWAAALGFMALRWANERAKQRLEAGRAEAARRATTTDVERSVTEEGESG